MVTTRENAKLNVAADSGTEHRRRLKFELQTNRFGVSALVVGLLCLSGFAHSATYEDSYTPKANRAYNEDINVWAYTSEFAERFGMPSAWIDDRLKGAYAVAYRVETLSGRTMFPHKGPEVSMVRRHCILDVYVPSDAKIPWLDERISDAKDYQPNSSSYLVPQSQEERFWRWKPRGIPHWDGPVNFGSTEGSHGGFPVRSYDKKVYPGVVFISFGMSCMTPPDTASWIELYDYEPKQSDRPGWPIWKTRVTGLAHRIVLPTEFMKRLYDHWYENSRRPAMGEWSGIVQQPTR